MNAVSIANSIVSFLFNPSPKDEESIHSVSIVSTSLKAKSIITDLLKQQCLPFYTTGRYLFGDLKSQELHWDVALMDILYAIPALRSALRLVGVPMRFGRKMGLWVVWFR